MDFVRSLKGGQDGVGRTQNNIGNSLPIYLKADGSFEFLVT